MAKGKQVFTVVVICFIVASTDSVAVADSSDGFMFELLLAHLSTFELRVHQQIELVQQNILRNRQDIERLGKRIAAEEELATKTDTDIFAKLVEVKTTSESVTLDSFDRLNAVKQSVLALQSQLENFGVRPMEDKEAKVSQSSSSIPFPVVRHFINDTAFLGEWLVIQNRRSGKVNFNRGWTDYKKGFGDVNGEQWLGLEKLHWLVSRGRHELLVALEDFSGTAAVAHYDDFVIGDEEDDYRLVSLGRYFGSAGDSLRVHEGCRFSTLDNDNDNSVGNCALTHDGGWWFDKCYQRDVYFQLSEWRLLTRVASATPSWNRMVHFQRILSLDEKMLDNDPTRDLIQLIPSPILSFILVLTMLLILYH